MLKRRMAFIALVGGLAVAVQGDLVQAGSCCGSGKSPGTGENSGCSQQASDVAAPLPKVGLHGGYVTATKANAFETVFSLDGVLIYRYTMQWNPRSIDEAHGKVEVQLPGGPKNKVEFQRRVPAEGDQATWFCPMHASIAGEASGACPKCGMALVAQDYLFAPIDLSPYVAHGVNVEDREIVGKVNLKGLGDPEKDAKFTQRGFPVTDPAAPPAMEASGEKTENGRAHAH